MEYMLRAKGYDGLASGMADTPSSWLRWLQHLPYSCQRSVQPLERSKAMNPRSFEASSGDA